MTSRARDLRILLVDDDDDTTALLALGLERAGCSVEIASSCAIASDKLKNSVFDVLITDANLYDGDGLALLVDSRPSWLRVAVVLTGDKRSDLVHRSRQRGFDDLLVKPLVAREILTVIFRLLNEKELSQVSDG